MISDRTFDTLCLMHLFERLHARRRVCHDGGQALYVLAPDAAVLNAQVP